MFHCSFFPAIGKRGYLDKAAEGDKDESRQVADKAATLKARKSPRRARLPALAAMPTVSA